MPQVATFADFPIHTVVLIILLAIVLALVAWLVLSESLAATTISATGRRLIRIASAAALVIWFAGRFGLAIYPIVGVPLGIADVIALTTIGLLIGLLPLFSAKFRQAVRAIPVVSLVAIHVIRFTAGGYFVTLLDAKLLPANFAVPAAYGDIFVALLSLVVVYFIVTKRTGRRALLIVWLVIGFADFASAFATGGLFLAPFTVQMAAAGGPAAAINFVLFIPTFIVPILASIQFYVIFQLRTGLKI